MRGMLIFLTLLASQAYADHEYGPFKDGRLGVNFAGYYAGIDLGGLLNGGARGGLFAEAGTPHGQSARAGLGGDLDARGRAEGGLFAEATATRNIGASAGLSGTVAPDGVAGQRYAVPRGGSYQAATNLARRIEEWRRQQQ